MLNARAERGDAILRLPFTRGSPYGHGFDSSFGGQRLKLRQGLCWRHAGVQVFPESCRGFCQEPVGTQPCLRLYEVLEAQGCVVRGRAVAPRDKVTVTKNGDKLAIVDASATIQRHACKVCGTHMYGVSRRPGILSTVWISSTPSCRRKAAGRSPNSQPSSHRSSNPARIPADGCGARAPAGIETGALRLPVAAADGFHRDSYREGLGVLKA